jgi:hypothetical protein
MQQLIKSLLAIIYSNLAPSSKISSTKARQLTKPFLPMLADFGIIRFEGCAIIKSRVDK